MKIKWLEKAEYRALSFPGNCEANSCLSCKTYSAMQMVGATRMVWALPKEKGRESAKDPKNDV